MTQQKEEMSWTDFAVQWMSWIEQNVWYLKRNKMLEINGLRIFTKILDTNSFSVKFSVSFLECKINTGDSTPDVMDVVSKSMVVSLLLLFKLLHWDWTWPWLMWQSAVNLHHSIMNQITCLWIYRMKSITDQSMYFQCGTRNPKNRIIN